MPVRVFLCVHCSTSAFPRRRNASWSTGSRPTPFMSSWSELRAIQSTSSMVGRWTHSASLFDYLWLCAKMAVNPSKRALACRWTSICNWPAPLRPYPGRHHQGETIILDNPALSWNTLGFSYPSKMHCWACRMQGAYTRVQVTFK